MATENSSLAIIPVDAHRTPAAKRPTTVFRIALPLVYAGMGVALGALTGVAMAFVTVPADASASDSAPAAVQASSANSTDVQNPHPAEFVRVAENESSPNGYGSRARAHSSPSATATSSVKEGRSTGKQIEPGKTPAAEKDLSPPVGTIEAQPRKHVAHPVSVRPRKVLASEPEVIDVPLENEQLATEDEAKSPNFYSEGDLTVADYNATSGTIETSDGRTFVLGTTVRASSSTSWDDYRSSVHYRCDQEGSCTLERAGAIAPNAKAI